MATERLILEIRTTGTRTVQGNLGGIGKEAAGANKTLALLRSTLVVVAGVRVISGFLSLADTLTNITNRVRLVTNSADQLSGVMKRLAQVSIETRSEFESNAIIFNRLARSAVNLGLTHRDLIALTRGLAQATAIAGATAQEARNSLIQFSQGLASGAVQGDELRSVAEQLPPIANAIAASFNKAGKDVQEVWGVSTKQLAEFGFVVGNISGGQLIAIAKRFEGILKAGPVLEALNAALGDFDEQFKLIDVTVSQAFTNFQTQLVIFTGGLAESIELGNTMNTVLTKIAANFQLIGLAIAAFVGIALFNLVTSQLLTLGSTALKVLGFLTSGFTSLVGIVLLPFKAVLGGVRLAIAGAVILRTAYVSSMKFIAVQVGLLGTRLGLIGLAIKTNLVAAIVGARRIWVASIAIMKAAVLGIPVALRAVRAAVVLTITSFLLLTRVVGFTRAAFIALGTGAVAAMALIRGGLAAIRVAIVATAAVFAAGFLPAILIIGAIVGLFFLVRFAIRKVEERFGSLGDIFNKVVGAIFGLIDGLVDSFSLLDDAIADIAISAGNKLIDGIEFGVNGVIALLNAIPGIDITPAQLGRFENAFEGSAAKVKAILQKNIAAGIKDGATNTESFQAIEGLFNKIKDVLSGGDLLGDLSIGEQNALDELVNGEKIVNDLSTATKKAQDAFDKLRASVDPLAEFMLAYSDAVEILDEALSKTKLTQEEYNDTLRLVVEDFFNVKDAMFDLQQQQLALNEAVDNGSLSADKASLAYRQFALEATSAFDQTLGAVFPVIRAQRELEEISVFLVKNQKLLADAGIDAATAQMRLAREAFGLDKTLEQVNEEIELLIQNQKLLGLTTEQLTIEIRKQRIAFLDTQRSGAAGAERALLKFVDAATDAATQTEKLFSSIFDGLSSQIEQFVETGTFSLNEFFRNIAAQLLKIGTQQALGGLLGAITGQGGGGFGLGGPASGGGASGGFGGLITAGLGSLFGFHQGGAFTVGANTAVQSLPGIDNRLIAFRARDNEEVTVTPKGAGVGAVGPTNIVFNVQAKDADSFRRSQSQLQNRLLAGIGQARRRR